MKEKRAFSVYEAAHYLGSSETVIKRETVKGNLPVRYLGAKKLYDIADLDTFFESLPFQRYSIKTEDAVENF